MEKNRYALLIIAALALSIALYGCTSQPAQTTSEQAKSSNMPLAEDNVAVSSAMPVPVSEDSVDDMVVVSDENVPEDIPEPIPAKVETQKSSPVKELSKVKEFRMIARQWAFEPGQIVVNKGDEVRLTIESADVAHGFNLPVFGISEYLQPGKTVVVEFTADKVGEHSFFCNVPCGSGHSSMRGTLVVEP